MPRLKAASTVASTIAEKPKNRYPGEAKGFVEEMRFVAMKLHTKEQAKEGEKEVQKPEEEAVPKWEPSIEGYLEFLVDSKLVYDTLEGIVDKAAHPFWPSHKGVQNEQLLNIPNLRGPLAFSATVDNDNDFSLFSNAELKKYWT